jgi:hypothetical protein
MKSIQRHSNGVHSPPSAHLINFEFEFAHLVGLVPGRSDSDERSPIYFCLSSQKRPGRRDPFTPILLRMLGLGLHYNRENREDSRLTYTFIVLITKPLVGFLSLVGSGLSEFFVTVPSQESQLTCATMQDSNRSIIPVIVARHLAPREFSKDSSPRPLLYCSENAV